MMSHVANGYAAVWSCTVLLFLSLCGVTRAGEDTRFYVALDGSDAWSGRLPTPNGAKTDGPFATLHRAREAVRALKQRDGLQRPVTVQVRAGTYCLHEPFLLDPDDSGTEAFPITYAAYPGETVVISGGRRITGEWRSDDGKIQQTHLPGVRAGKWYFRQLRVGGERQTRARYPNADPSGSYLKGFHLVSGLAGGFRVGLGSLQERGMWLEYDVEIPADGEYALRVFYANSGSTNMKFFNFTDMSNRTTVSIDGADPIPVADLSDTGSFYSGFRWSRSATLSLTGGKHVVRWTNEKGGALSLLAFMLCDDPSYAPTIPPSGRPRISREGRNVVIFQAEKYQRKHGDLVQQMEFMDRKDPVLHRNFPFEPGALKAWPRSPDAEIFVIPEYDWVSELVRLVHVDEEAGMV